MTWLRMSGYIQLRAMEKDEGVDAPVVSTAAHPGTSGLAGRCSLTFDPTLGLCRSGSAVLMPVPLGFTGCELLFLVPVLRFWRLTLTPAPRLCPRFFSLHFLFQIDPEKCVM